MTRARYPKVGEVWMVYYCAFGSWDWAIFEAHTCIRGYVELIGIPFLTLIIKSGWASHYRAGHLTFIGRL